MNKIMIIGFVGKMKGVLLGENRSSLGDGRIAMSLRSRLVFSGYGYKWSSRSVLDAVVSAFLPLPL